MKLSRLDAGKDSKVICWCRTQASSHKLHGVVDRRVNEAGLSTVGKSVYYTPDFAQALQNHKHETSLPSKSQKYFMNIHLGQGKHTEIK